MKQVVKEGTEGCDPISQMQRLRGVDRCHNRGWRRFYTAALCKDWHCSLHPHHDSEPLQCWAGRSPPGTGVREGAGRGCSLTWGQLLVKRWKLLQLSQIKAVLQCSSLKYDSIHRETFKSILFEAKYI